MAWGIFPEAVWIQVLVRLPVKSLLRFKSLGKSWFTLIESSYFIDLHTTTTTTTTLNSSSHKFGSFILLASIDTTWSREPFQMSRENSFITLSPESKSTSRSKSISGWRWWRSIPGSNEEEEEEDRVFKVDLGSPQPLVLQLDCLGIPLCYKDSYFFKKIVGYCNGIICLYDPDVNKFSLWNPATEKHRILPGHIENGVDWPHKFRGFDVDTKEYNMSFGFDVVTKDYKVVLLIGFRSQFYRTESIHLVHRVEVYSLSTDSWRLLEGITCLPGDPFRYPREVQYSNGSCFFMAHSFGTKHHQQPPCIPENDKFIISFDFTKEIITSIQLPDHHQDQTLYLSSMADKIALFIVRYQPRLSPYPPLTGFVDEYSMWALSNEGGSSSSSVNKDSWTKLHSFQIAVERPSVSNIPRGISNDGKFALLEIKDPTGLGKRMKLYHFVSKQVKTNFLSCGSVESKANAYTPTLVSIIGGNDAAYEAAVTSKDGDHLLMAHSSAAFGSKKRHKGCSFSILDVSDALIPEYPPNEEVVGVITMEDVIEELLQEEILDETDEYINIHNRIKVNMQASQGKVPNLNSPEPIGYLNRQHSPVTPHLVAPRPTPTLSVSTGTSASGSPSTISLEDSAGDSKRET